MRVPRFKAPGLEDRRREHRPQGDEGHGGREDEIGDAAEPHRDASAQELIRPLGDGFAREIGEGDGIDGGAEEADRQDLYQLGVTQGGRPAMSGQRRQECVYQTGELCRPGPHHHGNESPHDVSSPLWNQRGPDGNPPQQPPAGGELNGDLQQRARDRSPSERKRQLMELRLHGQGPVHVPRRSPDHRD